MIKARLKLKLFSDAGDLGEDYTVFLKVIWLKAVPNHGDYIADVEDDNLDLKVKHVTHMPVTIGFSDVEILIVLERLDDTHVSAARLTKGKWTRA